MWHKIKDISKGFVKLFYTQKSSYTKIFLLVGVVKKIILVIAIILYK